MTHDQKSNPPEDMGQLRDLMQQVYQSVDEQTKRWEAADSAISQIREGMKNLDGIGLLQLPMPEAQQALENVAEVVMNFQKKLNVIDESATVIHRELSHLQEFLEQPQPVEPKMMIRTIPRILHLSTRLAFALLPFEYIETVAQKDDDYTVASLRVDWEKWLDELRGYLEQVCRLSNFLLDKPGLSLHAYSQSLLLVMQQMLRLSSFQTNRTETIEPQKDNLPPMANQEQENPQIHESYGDQL